VTSEGSEFQIDGKRGLQQRVLTAIVRQNSRPFCQGVSAVGSTIYQYRVYQAIKVAVANFPSTVKPLPSDFRLALQLNSKLVKAFFPFPKTIRGLFERFEIWAVSRPALNSRLSREARHQLSGRNSTFFYQSKFK